MWNDGHRECLKRESSCCSVILFNWGEGLCHFSDTLQGTPSSQRCHVMPKNPWHMSGPIVLPFDKGTPNKWTVSVWTKRSPTKTSSRWRIQSQTQLKTLKRVRSKGDQQILNQDDWTVLWRELGHLSEWMDVFSGCWWTMATLLQGTHPGWNCVARADWSWVCFLANTADIEDNAVWVCINTMIKMITNRHVDEQMHLPATAVSYWLERGSLRLRPCG